MDYINRQIRLAKRPEGLPQDDVWDLVEESIPTMGDGQILVGVSLVSLDPAMRGWIREGKSYVEPVEVGAVMRALGIGKVMASNNPKFQEGDYVCCMTGVQQFALLDGRGVTKVDPRLAPLAKYLNPLGMTGMTAYFGLLDVGQPKPDETVLVSAAAGAVGSIVGQIAKIKGCRTVGIAGGADKCAYLKDELGYDEVIDYKAEDLHEAIKRTCPRGVDVYFDNVGGETLEAALSRLNFKARVVICGAITQYNLAPEQMRGPRNYLALLVARARMEGMVVMDYAKRYPEAIAEIGTWMGEGRLRTREQIDQGIANFPSSLRKLFSGENFGKLILDVQQY